MFCENCGNQIPDGSAFCENCGARVDNAGSAPLPPPVPGGYQGPGPQFTGPQPGMQQGAQRQQPVKPPKKGISPAVIVIIVIAAVLFLGAVIAGGIFAFKKITAKNEPAEEDLLPDEDPYEDIYPEEPPSEEPEDDSIERYESDFNEDEEDTGFTEPASEESFETKENEPADDFGGDWFEANGLKTTSPSKFMLNTMWRTKDENIEVVDLVGKGKIYEKYGDGPDGYKKVVFYFELDCSKNYGKEGEGPDFWITAFDRTSGMCFEARDGYPGKDENGLVEIKDGLKASVQFEYGWKEKLRQARVTATVPEDYEDTMFQLGYSDVEMRDDDDVMDMSKRLYRIDEIPFFDSNGHKYMYFDTSEKTIKSDSSEGKRQEEKTENTGTVENDGGNSSKTDNTGSEKKGGKDDILELAKKKSGAPNAVLDSIDADGTYNIRLTGETGSEQDTWDWYYINPKTLKGTNILGEEIDLNN